jgi:hypothetical protein
MCAHGGETPPTKANARRHVAHPTVGRDHIDKKSPEGSIPKSPEPNE